MVYKKETDSNYYVHQYNNTYDEEFVDDDFNNNMMTTATWGSINHKLRWY